MLEHSFSQFFPPSHCAPRHWPCLYVCVQNSPQFPVFLEFAGTFRLLPNMQTILIPSSLFPLSYSFWSFPAFARLSFFLIQIGRCALKRSAFPRSKQAALFSALRLPDLICSKSPFNCNPSILAKRPCLPQKVSFSTPNFPNV